MLNWKQISPREAVKNNLSRSDINDTNNAFWKVDSDLAEMLREMTLTQRESLNKIVSDFKSKLDKK